MQKIVKNIFYVPYIKKYARFKQAKKSITAQIPPWAHNKELGNNNMQKLLLLLINNSVFQVEGKYTERTNSKRNSPNSGIQNPNREKDLENVRDWEKAPN